MTDARMAAVTVLRASPDESMHWTVVWDRALRERLVDPMSDPDAREKFLRALAQLVRDGEITKTSTGTYRWSDRPDATDVG